ncbi:MAG: acyl-CoA desaturase [Bacteroidia bacterium]
MIQRVKFVPPPTVPKNFFHVLRKRVDDYFQEGNLSPHANATMVIKTLSMFAIYLVPFFMILSLDLPLWTMWALTAIMGVGLAGIGLSVMHDANHGAYSSNKYINQILGFTLDLIGGSSTNWKVQHNILHHTYTNIPGLDEDIRERVIVRLSPEAKRYKIHWFQHYYAVFFYGFMTFTWVAYKDIMQYIQYAQTDMIKNKWFELFKLLMTKVLYYSYIFVLPLMVLDITWWQYLIGFVTMHYVAGMILAVIFQMAHVVEETSMPSPTEQGTIENLWAIHQLETTANFSNGNRILNWYAGGLNFQIEHHLFPKICHVHYTQISKIVKKTAEEYGLPYYQKKDLKEAMQSHLRLLKQLGRNTHAPAIHMH